jgi:excinuclease ABC subunit A
VGRGKGYHAPARRRRFLPVEPFPRIDRFKEHTIELPVADLRITPANRKRRCATLSQGARDRQGHGDRAVGPRRRSSRPASS